eukprot:TRINITY_DN26818_c0_g1_i1.p1 TRINITY_DN26818_c0_g1~~TRINITY_DN26818_c0_g1_i1.p1  ORF type:complete len:144 (+),score=20.12 TRINITY_DN26818_c0_g1_i1:86-517(+)
MPAASVQNVEKVVEAGNRVYADAIRRWPKKYVITGLLLGGAVSSSLMAQTFGWASIHDSLDFEVPACKKVHLFISRNDSAPGEHKRLHGLATVGSLIDDKTVVTLKSAPEYPLNANTPLWTLCKSANNANLPTCSLELRIASI